MRRKALIVLLMLGYTFLFHHIYAEIISPAFSSNGMTYRAPVTLNYVIAIALVLMVTVLFPDPIENVSAFMLWLLWLTAGAPAILLAQYSQILSTGEAMRLGFVISLSMVLMRFATRQPMLPTIRKLSFPPMAFWLIVGTSTILVNAYLLLMVGVQFRYLAFADVTTVRQQFESTSAELPFVAYILPSQYNVIGPFLIYYGLSLRRFTALSVGLVSQAIAYLTTGQRHIVLMMLLLLAIYSALRVRSHLRARGFLFSIIAVSGMAMFLDFFTSSQQWTSILVRRFLMVPGTLVCAYVAVFQEKAKGNFLDVVGDSVGSSRDSAALVVGREFLHSATDSANANLFGHGYYSYGYIGVFIEVAFVIVLMWLADAVTRDRIPLGWACAIFTGPAVALTNSSPFTTVVSHGFVTALLLAAVLDPGVVTRPRGLRAGAAPGSQPYASLPAGPVDERT